MQQPQQDMSGDYGYDLAHDDARTRQRAHSAPRREATTPARPERLGEPAGDLEYDEAHDF